MDKLIFTLVFVLVPVGGKAATYYVATNGNNSNSCAQAQNQSTPKLTINAAIACLSAGSTLFIRGGTYPERLGYPSPLPAGTSWSNVVTFKAYPGESVIIRPSQPSLVNLGDTTIQYIVFDSLIFDCGLMTGVDCISVWGGPHHIRFSGGEIRNHALGNGVLMSPGGPISGQHYQNTYFEFIGVKIHHNSGGGHGLYMGTSNNLVENCEFYNNGGYNQTTRNPNVGLQIYSGDGLGSPSNNIVRNNIFHDNGDAISGGGIVVGETNNTLIYNNVFYNNTQSITTCCHAQNTQIYNNTIYGSAQSGIQGGNMIVKNNILWNNAYTIIDNDGNVTQSNNLTVNPLFVNAAGLDFSLQSTSPAINAGTTLSQVTTDINGITRVQPDIGAYEYATPGPTGLRIVP